jgi:hypothetical protein
MKFKIVELITNSMLIAVIIYFILFQIHMYQIN